MEPPAAYASASCENDDRDNDKLNQQQPSKPDTTRSRCSSDATTGPASNFSRKWTHQVNRMEHLITTCLRFISKMAATHAKVCVASVIFISFTTLIIGGLTNFETNQNEEILWTPRGSKPLVHMQWINDNIQAEPRGFALIVHANGAFNVASQEGLSRIFQVVDNVRETPGYHEVCAKSGYVDSYTGMITCDITGVTNFWNHSSALFRDTVSSDSDARRLLSSPVFPDGRPADLESLVGYPKMDDNGTLVYAQSYVSIVKLPESEAAKDFEKDALGRLLDLQDEWESNKEIVFTVDFFAERSFEDESARALVNDTMLVPVVFLIMSVFTYFIFAKRDRVQSRSLLGLGAVMSVFLAIMTGYGLLFMIGVPLTSMTQILPFIMFGIGLDNSFIISCAYGRIDPAKNPVERVDDVIAEVGLGITLTTMTSVLAFGLGAVSSIPAIYWLCYYAFPTIAINFLYQITFFVSLIVLDEQRIQANRMDCCVCIVAKTKEDQSEQDSNSSEGRIREHKQPVADRIMEWYANNLMKVKIPVLVIFATMLGGLVYSASLLKQEFKFTDVLPSDSYVTNFKNAISNYYSKGATSPYAYFRFVDQSNEDVQREMDAYVNALVNTTVIEDQPSFFWLRDFQKFAAENAEFFHNMTFNQQVDIFLSVPVFNLLYNGDVIRDDEGEILVSRVFLSMPNVDLDDVNDQIDALMEQRAVSENFNRDSGSDWRYFTWDSLYNIWEFYSKAVDELIFTTILGVMSVTLIALLFIPHWTAALFVTPLICILYVDLLGFMQLLGAHINAVSYVAMVMSIGLLVDFVIHILLRYYESPGKREEKVKATLISMGAPISIGALSTFLGIIPLGFSTSEIFNTIFYAFLGLVVLGSMHGLILLPVVLSLIGPLECVRDLEKDYQEQQYKEESIGTGQSSPEATPPFYEEEIETEIEL